MIRPTLDSYTLDMNTGIITLTFSESIDTELLDLSSIFLLSSITPPTTSVNLTGSIVGATGLEDIIPITILGSTLNLIKATPTLAVSNTTVFLSIKDNSTKDVNNNLLSGISNSSAIGPESFIPDTNPPSLIGFEIVLIEEPMQLILTFNETVDPSTLTVTSLSLSNNQSPPSLVTLDGSKSTALSTIVTITVTDSVLRNIRNTQGLATTASSTFLNVTAGAIQDTSSTPIASVVFGTTNYRADLLPPFVSTYTFDLDAGEITITFDNPVQFSSFNVSKLFLSESNSSLNAIRLDQATPSATAESNVISVSLSVDTVDTIKLDLDFATHSNNTYIYHESLIVCDIANNCAEELESDDAVVATTFIADTTSPRLLNFELNINASLFTLTFDEIVDAETLDTRQFTVQNMAALFPTVEYTLSSGTLNSTDGKIIRFFMTREDRNSIQALNGIMETSSNTFLSITSDAIRDMSGNYVSEIRPRLALQVNNFLEDTDRPRLLSAT
uniref:Uncharacterized protein n=1 Tax=Amphimedon queenslandica TaxID=400682 RepID=A0A1X7SLR0_AMPQE